MSNSDTERKKAIDEEYFHEEEDEVHSLAQSQQDDEDDLQKQGFYKYTTTQKSPLKLTKEQHSREELEQIQEGQEEGVPEQQAVTYSLARRTISTTKKKTLTLKPPSGSQERAIPTIQVKKQKQPIVVQMHDRYEDGEEANNGRGERSQTFFSEQIKQGENNQVNMSGQNYYENRSQEQQREGPVIIQKEGPKIQRGKTSALNARAALYQQQLSFANYNNERAEQTGNMNTSNYEEVNVEKGENHQESQNFMRHTIDSTHHQIFQQPSSYAPIPVIYQNNSEKSLHQQHQSLAVSSHQLLPVEPQKPLTQRGSRILEPPHTQVFRQQRHSGSVRSGGSRSPKPVVHFTYNYSNKSIPPPSPPPPPPPPQRPPQHYQQMYQSNHSLQTAQSQRVIQKPQSQPPQIYSYGPPPMPYRQQLPPPQPQIKIIEKTTTTIIWERHYLSVVEKFTFFTQRYSEFYEEYKILCDKLDSVHTEAELHQLRMRNTLLLEKMSETQRKIWEISEEQRELQKQIEQERIFESEGQFAFAKRYATLEKHCRELEFEIQKMKESDQIQSPNQQTIAMVEELKREMKRYESVNIELQNYIKQLETDNQNLQREIKRLSSNTNNMSRDAGQKTQAIIENQEKIIRDLEYQLEQLSQNHKHEFNQGRMSTSQQSAQITIQNQQITIQSLEQRIIELERENKEAGGGGYNQYNASQDQYRRIVQTQQNIIANLEAQLKELSGRPETFEREDTQMRKTIENQQNIINNLQNQMYSLQQLQGSSTESEAIIAQKESEINRLHQTIRSIEEEKNTFKGQLLIINSEIEQIRREKIEYKEMMERKLDERLSSIQEELKGSRQNDRYPESSSPKKGPTREQISELQAEIQRLSSELRRRLMEKRKLEEDLLNVEEGYKRTIMEKESNIRLLRDEVQMLNQEIQRKISEKDRKIRNLQEELSAKNWGGTRQITPVEVPSNSNEEIRSLKEQINYKNEENSELIKQKGVLDKKNRTLQESLNALQEQFAKKNQELVTIRRQVSGVVSFEQEIHSLNDSIAKKNQQILDLKSAVFERNQLQVEIQSLKNERNNLRQTLKVRSKEEDRLKDIINQLQIKLKGKTTIKYQIPNSMESSSDLQFMEESVRRKETQITKLKQSVQLKDTNIEELQYEVQKLKGKLNSAERALNHERQDAREKTSYLEGRIKELEQKAKNLDESQKHNKNTYEIQLQNLENLIKERDDSNRRLEGELKVLKNKLKNHDSKTNEYDAEIQSLNEKIKELENAKSQLKKHIDDLQESGHLDKNKLYDEYQIKIVELEAGTKMKDQKIKHLENNIQTLKLKMNDSGNLKEEDFINQQQIEVLRKKVAEYQSKLHHYSNFSRTNINYNFSDYNKDYDAVRIFENKLIYNLKKENQMLRENQAGNYNSTSSNIRRNKSQHVDYIQKRLYDFNQKLEEMIRENRELQEAGEFHHTQPQRFANEGMIQAFERNKMTLMKRHNKEIRALQARMVDLQRYCSHLEHFQGSNSTVINNTTMIDNNKMIVNEQITYYKEKNKQLEDRIDSHIKLNRELKQKLQSIMKSCGDQNALEFYKQQLEQLQRQNEDYLNQIKLLTEQNRQLQKSVEKYCNDDSMELKVSELENQVSELRRKNSQLQMQNNILASDIERLTRETQLLNENNSRLESTIHDKTRVIDNLENNIIREYKTKCDNYELTIAKMMNKTKFMEAEIERLNELIKNRGIEENSEITKLKNKILELQQNLSSWEINSQSWKEQKQTYEYNISGLNRRISNLETENQRLSQLIETYSRNDREHDQSMRQIVMERDSLIDELNQRRSEVESLSSLLERLRKERDNDGSVARDRLAYLAQIEDQLRQVKLQNQNLKASLTISRQQIENQRKQIEALNKQIKRLSEFSSDAGELKRINQQLRIEIDEEKKANSKANQEIQRLRSEIQHLQSELYNLKMHLEEISTKMMSYQKLMESIAYHMEFIRSTFLESESLLGQIKIMKIDNVQANVVQGLRANVNRGLIRCSQVFALI